MIENNYSANANSLFPNISNFSKSGKRIDKLLLQSPIKRHKRKLSIFSNCSPQSENYESPEDEKGGCSPVKEKKSFFFRKNKTPKTQIEQSNHKKNRRMLPIQTVEARNKLSIYTGNNQNNFQRIDSEEEKVRRRVRSLSKNYRKNSIDIRKSRIVQDTKEKLLTEEKINLLYTNSKKKSEKKISKKSEEKPQKCIFSRINPETKKRNKKKTIISKEVFSLNESSWKKESIVKNIELYRDYKLGYKRRNGRILNHLRNHRLGKLRRGVKSVDVNL